MGRKLGLYGGDENLLAAAMGCDALQLAGYVPTLKALIREAQKRGLKAEQLHDTLQSLLDADIDAYLMDLPPHAQNTLLGHAMELRRPCCVAMPVCEDAGQMAAILALSRKTQVPVCAWNPDRCRPVLRHARRLLRQGRVGAIRHLNVEYALRRVTPNRGMWLIKPFLKPVNQAAPETLASWALDDVAFLTGLPTVRAARQLAVQGVPQESGSSFLTQLGRSATAAFQPALFATGASAARTVEVYGSSGTMVISFGGTKKTDSITVCDGGHGADGRLDFQPEPVPPMPVYTVADAFAAFLEQPADAIPQPLPEAAPYELCVSPEEAYASQRVLDAVLNSQEEGQWVDL